MYKKGINDLFGKLITAERCRIGYEEQNEWYFFSHKDKKYPTGTRTNRATMAGFWKATGRDKAIYDKTKLIGMRKTLVFYRGRAPNGQKTDWIMHEYRLESDENGPPQASLNSFSVSMCYSNGEDQNTKFIFYPFLKKVYILPKRKRKNVHLCRMFWSLSFHFVFD